MMRTWKTFAAAALLLAVAGGAQADDRATGKAMQEVPMEEVLVAAPQPSRASLDELVAAARPVAPMQEITLSADELKISRPKLDASTRQTPPKPTF